MRRVRLDLPSELANEHANVTSFRAIVRSPDCFQEFGIGNWSVGFCEEVVKEFAFLRCEANLASVRADAVGAEVNLTVFKLHHDLFFFPSRFVYPPAQNGRNSSQKARSTERFPNIVIDSGLESSDFFLHRVTLSDCDEGDLRFGRELSPCSRSSSIRGEVRFEDYEIRTGSAQAFPAVFRAVGLLNFVPAGRKYRSQALPRSSVFIDDENQPRFHSGYLSYENENSTRRPL